MTPKISAYMLTHNNQSTVERAVQSLKFADEVVVVDSYSTDGTVDIIRKHTDRVIQRTWSGFRDQYQFAHDQCTNQWAVYIDADEEISEELAREMRQALETNLALPPEKQVCGFRVQRRTFFLDRWIHHGGWVPDREIRLYNRERGGWSGDLHAEIQVQGSMADLKRYCYHYSYQSIEEQLGKMNSYSTTASESMRRAGAKSSMSQMMISPIFRFLREYILKRGFLDGIPGFIIAVNNSFYVFNKHAKLWERSNCQKDKIEFKKYENQP